MTIRILSRLFVSLCCACALLTAGVAIPSKSVAQETVVNDGTIAAELDAQSDLEIEQRLVATFSRIESLNGVSVEVRVGVVRLTGEVLTAGALQLAADLAGQVEGVVAIENEIKQSRSIERRLRAALGELEDRGWGAVSAIPLLIVAILLVGLFVMLGRLLTSWEPLYRWTTDNVFLRDLVRRAIHLAVILTGVLLALELLDATALVGTVLGAAGVAGLAIGFAFRDLVENYIASVLLSLRQPFAPNDHVLIEGHEGKVVRLTSRATILMTFDGNHVRIPNSTVFKSTIVNFSRKDERRFQFDLGLGNEEDITTAQALIRETLAGINGIMHDPEPFTLVRELGDSTVNLRIFAWVDQQKADFGRTRSEAIRLVKEAFDRAGIAMPEPIQRVLLERVKPAPESAADTRAPAAGGAAPDAG
ncbi:MAG: mechanosensitive ion channel family protein, partial [Gemmatimonadetes bacterium]|nr:mechanosensitive ion channel family protein [Gemmatimonadota bacterium]